MRKQAPIIIVGGGPVGAGLAIELAQRDICSILVERYPTPQPIPKGQNLTQRTMEHFYFWGIEDQIRAACTIPKEYGIGGLTAYGTLLSDYHYDWLQRGLVRPYYFTDNERLPQYATEAVLRHRVAELEQVETRYGWTAESINQDEHGVTVTIAATNASVRETLRETLYADYVVGCDGSKSLVREQAGIEQSCSDHDRLMVLLVFRSPELHQLLQRYPGKSYYNVLHPDLQGYWRFFGRVDLGETWFFHAPVPPGTTQDNYDFLGLLHAAVGAEFAVEFEHIGFWELRIAVANNYRNQRVFIAGDAAHSHPPYGGYGINTGFEDARNLGWKLAATINGWGTEHLLDSYSSERQPVFVSTAEDFIENSIQSDKEFVAAYHPDKDKTAFEKQWQARASGGNSDVLAFAPNYEGSTVVWGPANGICSAKGDHSLRARAGHHLAPQMLSCGQNIFTRLGDGFTLLAVAVEDSVITSFVNAAEVLNVPFKVIKDSQSGGREQYGHKMILIRPDHFVAWAADELSIDAKTLLKQVVGGHRD